MHLWVSQASYGDCEKLRALPFVVDQTLVISALGELGNSGHAEACLQLVRSGYLLNGRNWVFDPSAFPSPHPKYPRQ